MRYYSIVVRNPNSGNVVTFNDASGTFRDSPTATQTWGSHDANGLFVPGSQQVELDIPALPFGTFQGNLGVKIWGVSLPALGPAANLSGYDIEILGGMKPPYALNRAAKPGQLAVGQIFLGYGNWEGTSQHLDLIVNNAAVNPNLDAGITFTWSAQQAMGPAIANALTAAFPGCIVVGADTVQTLVQDHDEPTVHDNLLSFAEYVLERTQTDSYSGIQIRGSGSTFYLYDSAQVQTPLPLQFQDLIGQPTWISSAALSFATVMRGDIALGSSIQMPAGSFSPYTLTALNPTTPIIPPSNRLGFNGSFLITEAHHFGDFLQADASAWRTEFVGVPLFTDPNALAGEPLLSAGGLA